MLQGAEIIFNQTVAVAWSHDKKELSVRAMENMVGVAMANPPAPGMDVPQRLIQWSGGEKWGSVRIIQLLWQRNSLKESSR